MDNFRVIHFESHKVPDFTEKKGGSNLKYILFGEKNDYPDYLIRLYQRSAKHNAIISGKVQYITGQGWTLKKEGVKASAEAKLNKLITAPNPYESLNDQLAKVSIDLELFGGFCLEVIWSKQGYLAEIYHLPLNKVRTNKDESEYYYTNDWCKHNPYRNADWQIIKPFNPKRRTGRQLLYFRQYAPKKGGYDVYPLPEYIGSIPYIEIDQEIANFHLNNIKNGFWPSFLLNFYNGTPTDEEQEEIEKRIRKKFSGSDNAGKFILNFADSKERGSEVNTITPPEFDKLFLQLNAQVQQEIFSGHKVTSPMLFGIRTEGQLGGRNELLEAEKLFQDKYVRFRQQQIERAYNTILLATGIDARLCIQPNTSIPLELPVEAIVAQMTPEEIRERAGLPPVKKSVGPNI